MNEVEARPRRLVVVAPGMSANLGDWTALRARLAGERGYAPEETRWLIHEHRSRWWSPGGLNRLARRLRATIARFTLPTVRSRNIAVFQDWYTEVLAEHPTAEFSIIAHSNGTYILGHSLLATPGMRFVNVALAGSVLPRNFWLRFGERLGQQVGRIRNDRADRDWPVALLCSALRGLFMRDIGTGGFAGFNGDATHEVAYHRGGHGEALKPDHHRSLVDFVFGHDVVEPDGLRTQPGIFRQLSNAAPYAAALGGLVALGALASFIFWGGDGDLTTRALLSVAGVGAVYVVLDVL